MPFLKRLGYYLIGLAIGLIFLAFFLKKKSEETGTEFCYLPNCRVLKDLRSKPLKYSPLVEAQMKDGMLDTLDVAYFLREGDVDFGESDTESEPCKYYLIAAEIKGVESQISVESCEELVTIERFEIVEE